MRNIAALKDLDRLAECRLRRDLQGCGAMHKNVCRIHNCNAEQTRRLDETTKLFSNYTDCIGKERAQSCNEIIALVGSTGEHDDSLLIYTFFLADVRYNPKVQIFIPCTWLYHARIFDWSSLQFPAAAQLHFGSHRMEVLDTEALS